MAAVSHTLMLSVSVLEFLGFNDTPDEVIFPFRLIKREVEA